MPQSNDLNAIAQKPLPERVTALLEIADLGQAEASRKANLHSQTVHWWVSGRTKTMTLKSARRFYDALADRIEGLTLEHVIGEG